MFRPFQRGAESSGIGLYVSRAIMRSLAAIALSNTLYTYNRHPDWAGSPPPVTTVPVMSLDIQELIAGGGCNPLSQSIHALFTAYHPYLATLKLFIEGPAPLPPTINPPISADGEADSPGGGQFIDHQQTEPLCLYPVAHGDAKPYGR